MKEEVCKDLRSIVIYVIKDFERIYSFKIAVNYIGI